MTITTESGLSLVRKFGFGFFHFGFAEGEGSGDCTSGVTVTSDSVSAPQAFSSSSSAAGPAVDSEGKVGPSSSKGPINVGGVSETSGALPSVLSKSEDEGRGSLSNSGD